MGHFLRATTISEYLLTAGPCIGSAGIEHTASGAHSLVGTIEWLHVSLSQDTKHHVLQKDYSPIGVLGRAGWGEASSLRSGFQLYCE